MRVVRVGMRWWLTAVFVAIAAGTALLLAGVASRQTGRDLRANAESIAVGQAVAAGFAVGQAAARGDLGREIVSIGGQHGLALFVFASDGTLTASSGLRTVTWDGVPSGPRALRLALHDHRYVESFNGSRATVVGLPLHRRSEAAALVAYAPRPPAVRAANDIFRTDLFRASLWAIGAAALAGLVAASLVARRLRRISASARAIEQGDFDRELRLRLGDEVGELAQVVDAMRIKLGGAFGQLSAERNRLQALLERLQEGVIAVDRGLRVAFANEQVEAVLPGVRLVRGERLPAEYDGLPLRVVARSLFAPDAEAAELQHVRRDGAIVSLVGLPATQSELAVIVVADVTEQERRRQAEREFVANASHELRTPVTAIASAVEALRNGALDDPAARDQFVDVIARQSTRLTRLTTSLLTLARAQTRQEELQLEPVELQALLEEVAAATAPEADGRLTVERGDPVTAFGRRDILEQVVSNLVGNALKHGDGADVVLRARRAGREATIEVSDRGPGIPPETQARIYDRFYAGDGGQRNGFGLGLAIARASTEALGGTLTIASEPGEGTTATVGLPLAAAFS